ncbi:MAG: hypothetical protein GKR88_18085 [Flavobacteriaceae bacterium]|nr:MAG: hypothetical protein GKR88_18085 [Flavobacteriaceae bacterium]
MKKIPIIISIFWVFSLNAQTTLIFDDKSGSVKPTAEQIKKRETILKKMLLQRINSSDDQVILSYLQKNSGNIANSKVLNVFKTEVPKSNETHILASIPRIFEELQLSGNLQVIYLSDMLEYSPRRKLYLRSKSEAEKKGIVDANNIIKDFGLSKSSYPDLQVDCYLPVSMTNQATTFSYISYYWKTVFLTIFQTKNIKFHTL